MKKIFLFCVLLFSLLMMTGCENVSEGAKVGTVTDLTYKGFIWKTWEGSLYLTQNGLTRNSDEDRWYFSIDRDIENSAAMQKCLATLQMAQDSGWIVKVSYHKACLTNFLDNRGSSVYLVTDVKVVNKHPMRGVTQETAQAALDEQTRQDEDRQRRKAEQSARIYRNMASK